MSSSQKTDLIRNKILEIRQQAVYQNGELFSLDIDDQPVHLKKTTGIAVGKFACRVLSMRGKSGVLTEDEVDIMRNLVEDHDLKIETESMVNSQETLLL